MNNPSVTLALLFSLTVMASAQQTGDTNRDYGINGAGLGGTSPVVQQLLATSSFDQAYSTLDSGAPLIWACSPSVAIGTIQTPNNSMDLSLIGVELLLDGTAPGFLGVLAHTDASGGFNLPFPGVIVPANFSKSFVMAHLAASSPDGWWTSQTHQVSWVPDGNLSPGNQGACLGSGVPVPLSDDSSAQVTLGFSFVFYGTSYTNLFIGSNGYITFGVGDSSLFESVPALLGGAPRISMWWDDLNPSAGGSVSFFTDNLGIAEVCFAGVPQFGTADSNNFSCQFGAGGTIVMDYGAMGALDGMCALSPGNNLDPIGTPLNLSLAGASIVPGSAAYELFTFNSPGDVAGFQVFWVLDALGQPVTQF